MPDRAGRVESPTIRERSEPTQSTAPVRSKVRSRARAHSTDTRRAEYHATTAAITTTGTKSARQETRSVSTPPARVPAANPTTSIATTVPIARPRSSSGETRLTKASEVPKTIAAPTPAAARAAIRTGAEGASAAIAAVRA